MGRGVVHIRGKPKEKHADERCTKVDRLDGGGVGVAEGEAWKDEDRQQRVERVRRVHDRCRDKQLAVEAAGHVAGAGDCVKDGVDVEGRDGGAVAVLYC